MEQNFLQWGFGACRVCPLSHSWRWLDGPLVRSEVVPWVCLRWGLPRGAGQGQLLPMPCPGPPDELQSDLQMIATYGELGGAWEMLSFKLRLAAPGAGFRTSYCS